MDENDLPEFQFRRRQEDALLLHIQELQAATKVLDAKLTHHHEIFEKRVEEAVEKVFDRSFPGSDPEGHRKVHEGWIEEAADKGKFWKTMKTELAKWGLLGFAGWAVYYLWLALLKGPRE